MFLSVARTAFPDGEDWPELSDRDLKTLDPDMKPMLGPAAVKAPAPVLGPHVAPRVGADPVAEPKGPNIPILPKPPIKVSFKCMSLCQRHQWYS